MKNTMTIVLQAVAILILTGCVIGNYWPANVSKIGYEYVGKDPNSISPLNSNLAQACELISRIDLTHAEKQIRLQSLIDEDNAKYDVAAKITAYNKLQGEQSYAKIIGSISNPGWT